MAANFEVRVLLRKTFISFALTFFLLVHFINSAKLTVPRILLPYNTGVSTNYTLEVKEGGCYKWSSSRYDLVSVIPLPSERERATCTTKALVSAVSRYPEHNNAIILAEDESDTFSGLEGVAFQWSLESESHATDAYGVLRFLKFADSVYKTPPSIEYWERQNLHGSMILIEGSKTGSAKVTVKPLDPVYKNVQPYEVSLVIVANLNLRPAHTYLLPGTKVKYNLELIKQGKAFPINLPSDQYYLEVIDETVATLDSATSVVTAFKYGSTNIVVKDRYITGREIAYLPSSVIHVAVPSYLTLSVSPGDKWSLEEQKTYFVSVQIYDRNSHPIYITEDVRVSLQFPAKYFQILQKSNNGTFQVVKTLIPGSCQVSGQLLGVASKDGLVHKVQPIVTASQDVTIYESIRIHPVNTLLPWDPVSKPIYSIYLKASGGTGSFNWMSSDPSLGSVQAVYTDDEQRAQVSTFGLGAFKVHATDAHIPYFSGSAEVSIQPVVDMQILPYNVEAEINGSLIVPVAMYGYLPDKVTKMFNNCSEVPLNVIIDDNQKLTLIDGVTSAVTFSACRNICFKCLSKGFSRIRAKYELEDISLKKALVVGCYTKLKAIYPRSEALIAAGSSMDLIFEGGPNPWPTCKGHFVEVSPQHDFVDTSIVKNSSESTDLHKISAFCKWYGEEVFTLKVGNRPCETNIHPASNEASVRIICAAPDSVTLRPVLPSVGGKKCPASADKVRIAVHSSQDLEIEFIVKDSYGREFLNVSSFDIKWYISDYALGRFTSNEGIQTKWLRSQRAYKLKYFQHLHPYGYGGHLKVSASILGYKLGLPIEINVSFEKPFPVINNSLNFILVDEAEVEPKSLSIFNSPSNKVYLNVTKGSGHFQIEASDSKKAHVVYNSNTRQIEISPLETGTLTITVTDLCLGIIHEAVAEVQIYGISAIVVDVLDKVQIGKNITASVEILNEDMQRIPASAFSLMNLQAVTVSDIISIKLSSDPEPHQYQAFYTITGSSLGLTSFKILTNANVFKGVQYSSDVYPMQVFAPLKLNPDHITLIVGATFQVLYTGGPQPQTVVEYTMNEKDIATISGAGVVEAKKIGKTSLFAQSVGLDKKGNTVVYSEDQIIVDCISLKEVKIYSPLSRMVVGTEMPLYVMGTTEQETPFTFGTALPSAKFKWSISNDKVASLHNLYTPMGLEETNENNFRVGLKALQDGLLTVRVDVTMPKESSLTFFGGSQILSSEIQIQVFKQLKLTNPEIEDGLIILSINSDLKLQCNRFGPAKVSYKIFPPENKSIVPVQVDEDGTLLASSKTGSAILLVTAIEEFGIVQRLTVVVKVEEVAYLMVKPLGDVKTRDWSLTTLPVGFTIPFIVTYHNNIGQKFNAVRSQLKFRASRHNLARVSFGAANNTLTVQVVKPGYTVLKVWDSESVIPADYIKIVTGTAIDPSDAQLIVGDVICFGSPLLTSEGHSGLWSTEKNVLSIHSISGGAVALAPGTTTVTYSLLNGLSTSAEVSVLPASYISIVPGTVTQISNLPRAKPYKIAIVIQSNDTRRTNNIVGRNCSHATESSMPLPLVQPPFSCELNFISSSMDVSVNDIFKSSSGFDLEKGMYFCSIESTNKISVNEASTLEGQLSLTVHLLTQDLSSSLSQQHLLSFLPAFHVQQADIVLSDVQHLTQIVISATPAVQRCIKAIPSDQTILRIKSPLLSSTYPASISFPVELYDGGSFWRGEFTPLHIDISCPLTKQQVRIPVRIKKLEVSMDGPYCSHYLPAPNESMYDWFFMFKIAAAVLTVVAFIYILRWFTTSRRGVVTTQPVFLNDSNGSHSFTSVRKSYSPPPSQFPSFSQRSSPTEDLENLSHPLRLCSLDTSPSALRRRSDNIFR
ncbi:nuclear pore membrane glycoprotein 210-like [Uloborus diversus]|uniref:nuclear pore membrane glycoprotein 210-like n=1 Tax=Uloborus diversus TaxID=327109 RepID=UPI002409554D|nr:nuclear pore membrane glycoprotein 210-like [Uloborus diversus]